MAQQYAFQVGEDKYNYKYYPSTFEVNGKPIYKCRRGTDEANTDYCLWLYKSADGHRVAAEAARSSGDPVNTSQPKFRTLDPLEDILEATGAMYWQWFDDAKAEWKGKMNFYTYQGPGGTRALGAGPEEEPADHNMTGPPAASSSAPTGPPVKSPPTGPGMPLPPPITPPPAKAAPVGREAPADDLEEDSQLHG
jgi:hypothetical protein